MKVTKKLILSCCMVVPLFILSGCGQYSTAYEAKQKDIIEYNELVKETLYSYGKAKIFAENNQKSVEEFVFTDKYFKALAQSEVIVPTLSEEEKSLFEFRSIIYNDFYTGLGASTIRQVMVIKGKNDHIMTVKIIWSENEIIDFKREVKQQ